MKAMIHYKKEMPINVKSIITIQKFNKALIDFRTTELDCVQWCFKSERQRNRVYRRLLRKISVKI